MKLIFRWYKQDPMEWNLTVQRASRLWDAHGEQIIKAFEAETGLKFQQREIRIRGSDQDSNAGTYRKPMRISVREKDDDAVLDVLTHELAHRLLSGNDLRRKYKASSTEVLKGHKKIYLFLYDVWVRALGKEMADRLALQEASIGKWHGEYKKAWDWAMSLTYEERQMQLSKLVRRKFDYEANPTLHSHIK